MATRESIEMDFRRALAQADAVDDIADRMSRISGNELGGTLRNLESRWKGEGANIFVNKGVLLQNKINLSAGDLRNIASNIRGVARRIHDTEMAALEIAQRRSY